MKKILAWLLVLSMLLAVGCTAQPQESTTTAPTTETTVTAVTTTGSTVLTTVATTVPTTVKTTQKTTQKTTVAVTTVTTTTTQRITTTTQPKKPMLRVLSIGNSFSQDAQHYLTALGAHEGRDIRTVNLYYAGCSLKKHYEFYLADEAAYNYEVNGRTNYNSSVKLKDVLKSEKWDVITLQESSYASCTGNNNQPYLNNMVAVVRQYAPQAKLYLHQTWAYADSYSGHNSATGNSMQAMWLNVEANYNIMSAETGLPLIRSGEAMFNAQQAMNARGKGESIQRDGSHADKAWGRYLLALVWYKTITGDTPSNTFDAFDDWFIEDASLRKMIFDTAMAAAS